MNNKPGHLAADPIAWLLEDENPSVRCLTLSHLLGRARDNSDVLGARAAIPNSSTVQRILSHQDPEGYWGDPESPYQPQYKATYWTVMLLGYLGLTAENRQVARAVEYLSRFQQPDGGFAIGGEADARKEHRWMLDRGRERRAEPHSQADFVADYIYQMTLSCLTGNVVAAMFRLGYSDDPRVHKAIRWLIDIQNPDGGWLCPYWKAHMKDTHACFHGTICALEALAEIPEGARSPALREAAERGAEFLLMHRLYRADHHNLKVINPAWLKLSFPWFYRYDILRGLWVLTRLGVRDERMNDALRVLKDKRCPDGRWVLESTPYGRMQANLEAKGEPSKWVTLMALYVLAGS